MARPLLDLEGISLIYSNGFSFFSVVGLIACIRECLCEGSFVSGT